ncbi:MAG: SDR family NAD(P)-dependent oxidoreductase [Desulfobulbaceae bacterium]|uniref:SDR family NAD(P)-dependent oxidoreductase n=1 Tax=Candidatus Desulfatifera sulfidica TaxID=2841691 RepID=A0A8J6NB12_9BACT|nr:SDR family NAD(P)-dependent oxidoreductase [Candidatus Desulfatifera sulfidica]
MADKKTILITGATAGFGWACARLFAAHNWRLILCGRRRERLEELREILADSAVHIAVCDVRDQGQVAVMIDGLPEEYSRIDVLLNNAGLALGLNHAQSADMEDWETMVDTNIKGLLYLTRAVLPAMVASGRGQVVNMGSVAGSWPYPGGNTYGATKAFVQQFSRNLRADLHGTGVRVTNIEPGMAETEFSLVRFHGDRDQAGNVYQGVTPLTGDDIAEIVYWTVCRPQHVNINSVEVMPTCQSWSPFAVHRESGQG